VFFSCLLSTYLYSLPLLFFVCSLLHKINQQLPGDDSEDVAMWPTRITWPSQSNGLMVDSMESHPHQLMFQPVHALAVLQHGPSHDNVSLEIAILEWI